jgi:hypothetical protein
MSNYRKTLIVIPILIFILACEAVTRPIEQAQGGASTAVALATELGGYATQAADLATQAAPLATIMANPSLIPEIPFGNPLNPQSPPLTEWNGIPVMPAATAGDEADGGVYAFKIDATVEEIVGFYEKNLADLGWEKGLSIPMDMTAVLLFTKGNQTLTVTIMPSEGYGTIVMFTLQ